MENDYSSKIEPLFPHLNLTVSEEEGVINFFDFLASIRRRWLMVTITTLIVSGVTFLWSATRPAFFKGGFQILVEPVTAEGEVVAAVTGESKTVLDQDLGETQLSQAKLDYETQLEVLLSRKLLEPVALQLESQFPSISYNFLNKTLKISRLSNDSKIIEVEYQAATSDEVEQVLEVVSRAYMAYSLKERQTNIKRAIEFTDNQLPALKGDVQQLEQKLQEFGERNLVTDPQVYTENLTRRSFELEQQLGDVRIDLQRKKQILASLQQQTKFQSKSGEIASVLSEAPLFRQLLAQLKAIETEIELKSATMTPNNPVMQDLIEQRERLLPLVKQAAEVSVGDQLPPVLGTPEGVPFQNALRQNLISRLVETEIVVKELEAVEKALSYDYANLQQKLITLPKINRVYDSLKRQLKIASDNFQNFQKVRSNLLINAARQEVPWELIEEPSKAKRVDLSSVPRDVSLGVILGILLGSGIAILVDKVRNTINTLDELRQKTQIPILEVIPFEQSLQMVNFIPFFSRPDSDQSFNESDNQSGLLKKKLPIIESFQSLYVSIRSLRVDSPIRSVVVSSCLGGEGRSTVAIHLAQAAAVLGQRVLLVDLDLRSPVIHQKFSLPQSPGIIELLALGNDDNNTIINRVEQFQNLYVVTSGTQIQEYSQYLVSEKIQNLMTNFQEGFFDLIIYDTPSLGTPDALLLSPNTDGLLLTVGLGKIDEKSLKEISYKLQGKKVNLLGIVANQVQNSKTF